MRHGVRGRLSVYHAHAPVAGQCAAAVAARVFSRMSTPAAPFLGLSAPVLASTGGAGGWEEASAPVDGHTRGTLSTHTGYSEYSHGRSAGGRKQAHRSMGTPELFTFVPARWRDDSPLLPIPMNDWSPPPASPACAAPARNPRRCGRSQTSGAYVGQRAHSPSADVGRVAGRQLLIGAPAQRGIRAARGSPRTAW